MKHSEKIVKTMHEVSEALRRQPHQSIRTLDRLLYATYLFVYAANFRLLHYGNALLGLIAAFIYYAVASAMDRKISLELTTLANMLDQKYNSRLHSAFASMAGFGIAIMEGISRPAQLPIVSFLVDISVPAFVCVGIMIYAARYAYEYDAKNGLGGGV